MEEVRESYMSEDLGAHNADRLIEERLDNEQLLNQEVKNMRKEIDQLEQELGFAEGQI